MNYIRLPLATLVVIIILLTVNSHGWAQPAIQHPSTVEILSADFSGFPEFKIDVRVKDQEGYDIFNLPESNFKVVENNQAPRPITQLTVYETSDDRTLAEVTLSKDTVVLFSSGATIAVVLDATTILNANAPPGTNYLNQAKMVVQQFLLTEAQAEAYPEAVTLYIPVDQPDQQLQSPIVYEWTTPDIRGEEIRKFTIDRNAVINYINNDLQPRSGLTSLYAAVRQAILDTHAVARQRGSNAVVFVVSDGADDISLEAFQSTIDLAIRENVKILAVGIGREATLQRSGFRLKQLADASGGMYLQQPDEQALQEAFRQIAIPVHTSIYQLSYRSSLPDDGREHTLQVQASREGTVAVSEAISIMVRGGGGSDLDPNVFNTILLIYFALAFGIVLLITLGITSISEAIKNRRRQILTQAGTRAN